MSCGSSRPTPGSSPLARGLPALPRARSWRLRIIPARAGFTGRGAQMTVTPWDHPRSRGVYRIRLYGDPDVRGSSPLARGLHGPSLQEVTWPRIIPARAGFTRSSAGTTSKATDHPRSRGVYPDLTDTQRAAVGSSPLARGLPRRASRLAYPNPDHPRSRGVYPGRVTGITASRGSSPLARGLR